MGEAQATTTRAFIEPALFDPFPGKHLERNVQGSGGNGFTRQGFLPNATLVGKRKASAWIPSQSPCSEEARVLPWWKARARGNFLIAMH